MEEHILFHTTLRNIGLFITLTFGCLTYHNTFSKDKLNNIILLLSIIFLCISFILNFNIIKVENDKVEKIATDCLLGFFGLIMKLGPIADWGLNLEKKTIPVNTENFQTNKEGIFAIGDICTYPGKLKLILSGFHEGTLAARACFKLARPNEKYRFEFTTTSKSIQEKLGVK